MLKVRYFRLLIVVLIICNFPFVLTACWDKLEVEESAFVAVIGLDKLNTETLEVTYVISNPQGGGFSNVLGSSQKEPPAEIVTIKGTDILSARDLLGASVTRRTTFSHARTLVISEELAKSDMLLRSLEAFIRDRQIRRDMFMIISKEKASEFIHGNQPLLETRPHKFYEFISQRWKETALVPISNIHRFMQRTEGKAGLFINIYGTSVKDQPRREGYEDEYFAGEIDKQDGNPIQIIGSAVFKNGVMVGILNGEETRISQILRPNFTIPSILTTLPDPTERAYRISGRVSKERGTDIKIDTTGDRMKIDVNVPVMYDILAIPSGVDYIRDQGKQKMLEEYISNALNEKAKRLVERTQKEFKGDPFLWSSIVRKQFSIWDAYENYRFMDKYPKAQVTVRFDVKIRRTGKQLLPPDFNRIRSGS